MNRGRLSIIAAVLVLVGAVVLRNYLAAQKKTPPRRASERTMEVVPDTVALGPVAVTIPVTGKLRARNRIEIYAEVSGRLLPQSDRFREGNSFSKGAMLIAVDDTEAKANLVAQKSSFLNTLSGVMSDIRIDYPEQFDKWTNYLARFSVEEPILLLPEVKSEKEKLFITARGIYTGYYNIVSAEARLDKYALRAPFHGVVTEANIEPGTLVRQGQKLGEFISDEVFELEVSLKTSDLDFVENGNAVQLTSNDVAGQWIGRIARINNRVDPQTQSVNLFVEVSGKGLREGMYLNADIQVGAIDSAFTVNRKMLNDQGELYVLRDSSLSFERVNVIRYTESTAIVRGLRNGTLVPSEPVPGAYPGMRIQITKP